MAQRDNNSTITNSSQTNKDNTDHFGWLRRLISHENFTRFARFGLIDQALLFVGFGLGFKVDKFITKRIGAAGLGPIIGAGMSNMIGDCAASLPEGRHAVLGILSGAMIPMIPIFGALIFRRQLTRSGFQNIARFCGLIVVGTYGYSFYKHHQAKKTQSLNTQNKLNTSDSIDNRTSESTTMTTSSTMIDTKK